jgi:hypothetical protein
MTSRVLPWDEQYVSLDFEPDAQSYEPDPDYIAALEDYENYIQEMRAQAENILAETDASAPLVKHLMGLSDKEREMMYWELAVLEPDATSTVLFVEDTDDSTKLAKLFEDTFALIAANVKVRTTLPDKKRPFYRFVIRWQKGTLAIPQQMNPMFRD